MKRIFGYLLSFMMFIPLFGFNAFTAYASGEHQFSVIAENCSTMNEDFECEGPTGNPEDELPEIANGGNVSPGQVIKLGIYYVPGTNTDIGMQIRLLYDHTLGEVISADDEMLVETDMSTTYYGGIWPAAGTTTSGKKSTNWQILSNDDHENWGANFIIQDSKNAKPLETEGVLAYIFFKINDDVANGTALNFTFDNKYTKVSNKSAVTTSGISFNVQGDVSANNNVKDFQVKYNSIAFTVTKVPTTGTDFKYEVVVPNFASPVEFVVTPDDEKATVSGDGSKTIAVGDNNESFSITAESGDVKVYDVKVKRLDNTAKLNSLSLTDINIGTFSSDKVTYSATVPYSTKTTTVTATAPTTAKINTGTSSYNSPWNLTNYGATVNTLTLTVDAEDCSYPSVPSNVCTQKVYTINVTREAPSTNAKLSDLKVDGTTVTGFDPDILTYTLTDVPNTKSSMTIAVTAQESHATISGTGSKTVAIGDNTFKVVSTAEDGTTKKEYEIKVRRLSNDTTLNSLSVTSTPTGTLNPASFSPSTKTYTYTAPATVTNVTIAATATNSNATVVSGPGTYDINTTSSVSIVVQAEDGSTDTYTVNLVRQKSTNANLATLGITGYTLNETFSPTTLNYTANVSGNVDSIHVTATTEDANATITSGTGTKTLVTGPNVINIVTKAEDGTTTKTYKLTVTRAKKTTSTLSDLQVDGVSVPDFSPTKLEYTLSKVANDVTSVNVTATMTDTDSTVTGTGVKTLVTGPNTLTVTVTAQDGVTKTSYNINIEREKNNNAYLKEIKMDGALITGFDKATKEYNITIPNEKKNVSDLNLTYATEVSTTTATLGGATGFSTSAVNVVTITTTAEDSSSLVYKLNLTREKNANNFLSSLTVSSGTLDPAFDKTKENYTVHVDRDVETVTVAGTPEATTSTVDPAGPSTLTHGNNTYTLTVTSEDGSDRVYTVVVVKDKSANNFLSDIKVDETSISGFNKNTTDYTVNVASTVTQVKIEGILEDNKYASLTGNGTFVLNTGVNTFSIVVTAEDGTDKTYTVKVDRALSTDSSLQVLSINEASITPSFESTKTSYTATVPYTTSNITVVATPTVASSTVVGDGSHSLNTGANTVDVVVTAEDGVTQTTYSIVVTREKNNNANLSDITLSGGYTLTPAFDPDTVAYSLTVPNTTSSLTITTFTDDPNAVGVTGDGNVNLGTGLNTINLVVTAEDGTTTKTYTLSIERELNSDTTLKSLSTSSGTLDPVFDKDTASYSIKVPNEIKNVTVNAVPTATTSSVSVTGNTDLVVGDNAITITVTAEDGSIGTYTINAERQKSANNFLQSLSIQDGAGTEYITTFNRTLTSYTVTVPNNVTAVAVNGVAEDTSSTVAGNTTSFDLGEAGVERTITVTVTSQDGIDRDYIVKITRETSANSLLSNLEVEGQTMTPAFAKDTYEYTVEVDGTVDNVKINASVEDSTSTMTGDGEKTLVTGRNEFDVVVTAQNGTSKTYKVIVNKAASDNNYLANLTISDGVLVPSFNKETLTYDVSVTNDISIIQIEATAEDSKATVSGDGIKSIPVGKTSFEIEVLAENSSKRVYVINIDREKSNNNNLIDITVDGTTIDGFSKEITEYTISVPNTTTRIEVAATKEDETATVTGTGTKDLVSGENIIDIKVTAEDGTEKTYKLKVDRALSGNNYLSSLSADEGTLNPEFDKDETSYTIAIPNEKDSLTLHYDTESAAATVTVTGNENFIVGDNEVNVVVTSEDGSQRTYTLTVTRQPEANNYLSSLRVLNAEGTEYALDKKFNKETLSYEVVIPKGVTSINVDATLESEYSSIEGVGNVDINTLPQSHSVVVSTFDGIKRTYTINFVQELSQNADLFSLEVIPGDMTPNYSKDKTNYRVVVPEETTEIDINAVKDDATQIVTGDGHFNVHKGRNDFTITVTSESGTIKYYYLSVYVDTNDNVLSSLKVDKGVLSPTFDPDTKVYRVELPNSDDEITVSAEGKYTITGEGTYELEVGANIIDVITTDDEGNDNIYNITVYRDHVKSPYLRYLRIDKYGLDQTFEKTKFDYSKEIDDIVTSVDIVAIPEDQNATVTIAGNNNLQTGNNEITITVVDEDNNSNTYKINVVLGLRKIMSNIHIIDDNYVLTIAENKTALDVKNDMINPNNTLKIYDLSNNEVSDSDVVGTGCIIKLEINGIVYDSKILIVKGDLNGDGEIGVSDIIKIRLHILETSILNSFELKAADTNEDDDIGVADLIQIRSHILGSLSLF